MSFSTSVDTEILNQVFVGTALSWNGNTNLWLALHTANPGKAGAPTTSEIAYTGYARIPISRSSGFTVASATIQNANLAQFPVATGGTGIATYCSVVTTASGAGSVIVFGPLNSSVSVTSGIQPQFSAGSLTFTLD
jgi:hypothetical protein